MPLPSHAQEVVSLAVLGDFSAAGAIIDREIMDGFSLGIQHVTAQSTDFSIKIVQKDIKRSMRSAGLAAADAVGKEGADFVVALSAQATEGGLEAVSSAGHLLFGVSGSPETMAGYGCSRFFFSVSPPEAGTHEAIRGYLREHDLERLFLVSPEVETLHPAQRALTGAFNDFKVGHAFMPFNRMVHTDDLERVRKSEADSVYLALSGGVAVSFVRQFTDYHAVRHLPLLGSWYTFEPPLLSAIGDRSLGAINAGFWSIELQDEINLNFVSTFEAEYNRLPSSYAALGYDTALIIGQAASKLKEKIHDTDAVRAFLRRTSLATTRGKIRYAVNHFPLTTYYQRKVDKDWRGRYYNRLEGVLLEEWQAPQTSSCAMRWTPGRPG